MGRMSFMSHTVIPKSLAARKHNDALFTCVQGLLLLYSSKMTTRSRKRITYPWWIDAARETNRDIQKICDEVRPIAEYTAGKARKCKVPFSRFRVVEYKTLLEHGTKYFVKVDAGVCYVHLCIHKDYECGGGRVKLEKMLVNLDEDYPLENFD